MRDLSRSARWSAETAGQPKLRLATVAVQMSFALVVTTSAIVEDLVDQLKSRPAGRFALGRSARSTTC